MDTRQPLLIVDLDGTVVNTYPVFRELMAAKGFRLPEMTTYGVCAKCGRCTDPRNPPEDCPVVEGFLEATSTLWAQPVEHSRAGVEAFIQSGWELLYLSSRQPQLWVASKNWLQRHHFPKAPVFCTGKWKRRTFEFLALRGEQNRAHILLVDDNPDVVGWAQDYSTAQVLVIRTRYSGGVPEEMLFTWEETLGDGSINRMTKELWVG